MRLEGRPTTLIEVACGPPEGREVYFHRNSAEKPMAPLQEERFDGPGSARITRQGAATPGV